MRSNASRARSKSFTLIKAHPSLPTTVASSRRFRRILGMCRKQIKYKCKRSAHGKTNQPITGRDARMRAWHVSLVRGTRDYYKTVGDYRSRVKSQKVRRINKDGHDDGNMAWERTRCHRFWGILVVVFDMCPDTNMRSAHGEDSVQGRGWGSCTGNRPPAHAHLLSPCQLTIILAVCSASWSMGGTSWKRPSFCKPDESCNNTTKLCRGSTCLFNVKRTARS